MQLCHLKLIKNKPPLGICFSGGADSLAAAHLFRRYQPTLYHFNHSLIPEDDDIEIKAKSAAGKLNLPFVSKKGIVKYKSGSVEAWCREQRYNWFRTLGGTLITGHNLSEATEGYMINCLRGCPEHLPIPVVNQFDNTLVIRPLILTPKVEILDYLQKHNLSDAIVDDPLNLDLTKRRNWIRASLIPEIKKVTNLEKVVKKRYLISFKEKKI